MMDGLVKVLFLGFISFSNVALIAGTGEQPDQGFFLASSPPAVGRKERNAYIYAIQTDISFNDGDIEIYHENGYPKYVIDSGDILGDGIRWGCYVNVGVPSRYPGSRFGQYNGKLTPFDFPSSPIFTGHTFLKQSSKILNTGGVYTVTVYPDYVGATSLSEETSIGVGFTPGCPRIKWCKGKQRNFHTGPRLTLSTIEDGGLYTIQRPKRGGRGFFSQIEVLVASCPEGMYDNSGTCMSGATCMNGGVLRDKSNDCICPPYYGTFNCRCVVEPRENGDQFVLGDTRTPDNNELTCSDLPGGNTKCRGVLICYGDLYGCKCAPGWRGDACDRPCPVGKWGVECSLTCPQSEPKCSPYFGPSANLRPTCS
ncbi:Tyrosine-protein kinase receptor Tie-2 [Holothuria leucospilota]|uniref:Tyrosine-protein kinase receptor Tie-2 n=1 Tax=Holothuria leucospilota TaxID=206669 RepID=A0A9Q1HKA7_HOLLE|nr:Tyrosine-protein kinase receptor Tie-2 [Holothuria leucospilota]